MVAKEKNDEVQGLEPGYSGAIYDYAEVVANEVKRQDTPHLRFRCAMPSWDNTIRRGKSGNVFQNAAPEVFEAWLSVLCAKAQRDLPPSKRLVFVNAWNEWGEGAYLEPDRRNGHRNLKAVRAALTVRNMLLGDALLPQDEHHLPAFRERAIEVVAALANANQQLIRLATDYWSFAPTASSPFIAKPSGVMIKVISSPGAACNVDSFNGRHLLSTVIAISSDQSLRLRGWLRIPEIWQSAELPAFLHLVERADDGEPREYIASILEREHRDDVRATFGDDGPPQWYGFRCVASLAGIVAGSYNLRLLVAAPRDPHAAYGISTRLAFHIG
jgi:hypothetical protein